MCASSTNMGRRSDEGLKRRSDEGVQYACPSSLRRYVASSLFQLSAGGLLFTNVHLAALELDLAVLERKEGVVAANADIEPRLKAGAALANNNRPGRHELTAVTLHA